MNEATQVVNEDILFGHEGSLGVVTLNRPKALNALTHEMASKLHDQLKLWADDSRVKAVVIRGAGEKAFCAGGDVRAIYDLGRVGDPAIIDFFADEYRLNAYIHHYPKPYVALIDGIVMGGGVGISVHGHHRVAGDRTIFAMPETGIGLFPDVGGTYFLPRCPGKIGMYLALTGARLKAADSVYAGIATAYVPSDRMTSLVEALAGITSADENAAGDIVARFSQTPDVAPLEQHRAVIDECFGASSVEAIVEALEKDGGEWALKTRDILKSKSPTSLKVTYRQMIEGAAKDFDDCMRLEFRVVQSFMKGVDVFEGIRSVIVDKDNQPEWNPDSLSAVSDADVDVYFAPKSRGELRLV